MGCAAPSFKDCRTPEKAANRYEKCELDKNVCEDMVRFFYCEEYEN